MVLWLREEARWVIYVVYGNMGRWVFQDWQEYFLVCQYMKLYLWEHREQNLPFVFFVAWLPINILWCEIALCITNILGTWMI